MGRASPVLSRRALPYAAVAVLLAAYYEGHERLWRASTNWDLAFVAVVLIPAVFALVLGALPAWRSRGLLPVGIAVAVLGVVLQEAGAPVWANFAKLGATTLIGFWFLRWFESVSWVVLVACIVPWVDAYSVWRGPTHTIVTDRPQIFSTLSFAFPVPGEHGAANLGLPDLLFFALFLAAAARFGLRTRWTWLALTVSFGLTMALAVWGGFAGLPALPGLSLAFLGVNADLLWRRLRRRGPDGPEPEAG